MNLSYWEIKSWLSAIDFTVVGSGIVGISAALELRRRFPSAKILILEKGVLPQGASTKNAGFACFGSLSEILEDLKHHSEEEVLQLIHQRLDGLKILRELLGDVEIDYQNHGGYELFLKADQELYEECLAQIPHVNRLLKPLFQQEVFAQRANSFGFKGILPQNTFNRFEGQIDTGKMMSALLKLAQDRDIRILNSCSLIQFSEGLEHVELRTGEFNFKTAHLLIATNGFAQQLISEAVQPARAQVLITGPIPNLPIKGTFHLDRGFYYFRNIDQRIMLGGGRHLDLQTEETTRFGQTPVIQERLEALLREVILPETKVSIDHRWSGIMGVGQQKKPIVKALSARVYCGVRLGGMGVAIGSAVGKQLAQLLP
jgi:glycine/D-amino acid oxidase-like deaminating enzyme